MSLLEDVFLEDEAGEAQELERVIEGDEFDERPAPHSGEDSNENSEKEDEAEEDKRRVDPTNAQTKRITRNPRVILNPARLTGPRGIQVIPEHFKDFKFKGKGHEKEDLDLVLKKLEHWAYRLYPKFQFEDCLKKIETLGKKRPVMVHLHKIRSDQYISDDVVVQSDSDDAQPAAGEDEFDLLLQQQIELARTTPSHSAKKGFGTPAVDTPSFSMPKATSSPSISEQQKERMLRNRRMAEERRLARLKNAEQNISVINEVPIEVENLYSGNTDRSEKVVGNNVPIDVEDYHNEHVKKQNRPNIINEVPIEVEQQNGFIIDRNENVSIVNDVPIDEENRQNEPRKRLNRSNVIDSSDDDCEELVVNESISVDVHSTVARKHNVDSDEDDENHEVSKRIKKHKPNVIDSEENSDDDSMVAANIEVPRPNNLNDESQDDKVMAINEESNNNAEVIKPKATDIEMKHNETSNKKTDNTEQKEIDVDNDKELSNQHTNHDNDLADHSKEVEDVIAKTDIKQFDENNTVPEETKISNHSEILNNKENIDDNVDMELVDMDFNEDF